VGRSRTHGAGNRPLSASDGAAFLEVDRKLKALAAYLQPFFLEPPPDLAAKGLDKLREGLRLARRFRKINGVEMGRWSLSSPDRSAISSTAISRRRRPSG
jgi:hypothetical protein